MGIQSRLFITRKRYKKGVKKYVRNTKYIAIFNNMTNATQSS